MTGRAPISRGFRARRRPGAGERVPPGQHLVGQLLLDLGHEPGLIKTERFGPTGG